MKNKKTGKKLAAFFVKHWMLACITVMLIILVSFLSTYPIKILSRIIDIVSGKINGGINNILISGLIFFMLHIFWGITSGLLSYFNSKAETTLGHEIRCEVFRNMSYMPQTFFDKGDSGDMMIRLVQDTQVTVEGFLKPITYLSKSIITFGMGMYFMISIDWRLTLFVLPVGFITSWYASKTGPRFGSLAENTRESKTKLWSSYNEGIRGMRDIQANCQQERVLERIKGKSKMLNINVMAEAKYGAIINSFNSTFFMGIIAMLTTIGGVLVYKGELSIGGLTAFMMYNGLLVDPLVDFIELYQQLQKILISASRINEILENPIEYIKNDSTKMLNGDIEFKDVSFSYDGEREVLKSLGFNIERGKSAAFVGTSGAGKTTIFRLISGFYTPTRGEIKVGGLKLCSKNLPTIRESIGIVFQDTFLFNGSIKDNIMFGNPDASEDELMRAISIAEIQPIIERLPDGIDTVVGENGAKLSGGEKQRVGIARALLRKPSILLLDEATSALDNFTTARIVENLSNNLDSCTLITIAHRLGTITNSDVIYVFEDGRIVEKGIHDDLIKEDGTYSALYNADNL